MELGRHQLPIASELLSGFRALVVNGPRQAGKSTLVRQLQTGRGPVFTLDDPTVLDLVRNDPTGFLRQLPAHPALDEFQRGGQPLLLALKRELDEHRGAGQYLLAGSTRFLTTRHLAETLTGRIGILELMPLSAGELRGATESFIERAFDDNLLDLRVRMRAPTRAEYAHQIATGGFPELALGPTSARFRTAWCQSYIATVTAISNVEQIVDARRPELFGTLLRQLAARVAGELSIADLARELAADEATVRTYLDVVSTLYLLRPLPAWTTSHTNRSKRRPVVHLVDTALASHLVGADADQLARLDSPWFGPLLENYVVNELSKQAGWCAQPVALGHYRDRDQREVDVVIERGRDLVCIEVKATSAPTTAHAKHLAFLRDRTGERFRCGVVLHTGDQAFRLGDRLYAVPVSDLWA